MKGLKRWERNIKRFLWAVIPERHTWKLLYCTGKYPLCDYWDCSPSQKYREGAIIYQYVEDYGWKHEHHGHWYCPDCAACFIHQELVGTKLHLRFENHWQESFNSYLKAKEEAK